MKKQILGMTALSIQLFSHAASGIEYTTLDTLKLKCREAQQYSQNNFKIASQFHCAETRTLWAKGTHTFNLNNDGHVSYQINVKGQLESDWIIGNISVTNQAASCPVLQKVNVTATAPSGILTCDQLNAITDERAYCESLLEATWADCTAQVAMGSVPFKAPANSACQMEPTSTILSCAGAPTTSSSSSSCDDAAHPGTTSSSSCDFGDKLEHAGKKVEKVVVGGVKAVGDIVVGGVTGAGKVVGGVVVGGAKGVEQGVKAVGKGFKKAYHDIVDDTSSDDSAPTSKPLVSSLAPVALGASVDVIKVTRIAGISGTRVVRVTSEPEAGSVLAKSGLVKGNVVWSVDGVRVKTAAELARAFTVAKSHGKAEVQFRTLSGSWEKRKVNLM